MYNNQDITMLTDYDAYLFGEGRNYLIYEKLGSHIVQLNGVAGVYFAVWAPTAKGVSVVGDFNNWDGSKHYMTVKGESGIWELFIPNIGKGEVYKYEITTYKNDIIHKSDPYANFAELKPRTASIVWDINKYDWNDEKWVFERSKNNMIEKPMSIYEVHMGSWKRGENNRYLTYRELAEQLVTYVKKMGYTHIELMPICEHPYDGSWGYQVTGYFAPTSRYGTPEDFMFFVDKCHQNNIGVIMDWVPAHFPKDAHGLARFDGTAVYEHENPMQGEHPEWGTLIFNYNRNEVKNFLISSALFWIEKYHIDGFRVDAVASMIYLNYGKKHGQWIPNKWGGQENVDAIEFIRDMNNTIHSYYKGVRIIAEESTSWAMISKPTHIGGMGYDFKCNMGGMNDFLKYMSLDPIYRKYHHSNLTFSFMYAFSESFVLPLSHDEVVHCKKSMLDKMPGDYWQKFANLRAAYTFMYGHPGKKILFMGGEFGQFIEWDFEKSLDWFLLDYDLHRKMQLLVRDLNKLYKSQKALWELDGHSGSFEWIDGKDADHGVISFVRKAKNPKNMLVFVCNFTPVVYTEYRIGVPTGGFYKEIFNSDSEIYGGSNQGNIGGVISENIEFHSKKYSVNLTIPPLSVIVFKPVGRNIRVREMEI